MRGPCKPCLVRIMTGAYPENYLFVVDHLTLLICLDVSVGLRLFSWQVGTMRHKKPMAYTA